ncbi:MAG: hypothetical protein V3S14_11465, partial [Anaerolineae bacterium]
TLIVYQDEGETALGAFDHFQRIPAFAGGPLAYFGNGDFDFHVTLRYDDSTGRLVPAVTSVISMPVRM